MPGEPDRSDVMPRLLAARARLIMEKPFIGTLLLHLPLVAVRWCDTVATDARALYFNPHYIERLSLRETQFVLAHQAMHCALGHFARRQHRVRKRWDLACDHAVNLLLVEEGLDPAPQALIDARFRGLSAEEIYPLLPQTSDAAPLDTHLFDFHSGTATGRDTNTSIAADDNGAGRDASDAAADGSDEIGSDAAAQAPRHAPNRTAGAALAPPADELARAWQMRFAQAAQQARHAGRLGASWQRLLERGIEPSLPWRAVLARFISSRAQDDYSFQRPARRETEALMPRLHSAQIDLFAILDTSGSVGAAELAMFAAEVDALKGQVRARVTVHACDQRLAADGPWIFQPWEPIVLPPQLAGGGGTDFAPVFEWIRAEALRPDLLLYFTDAEGDFPPAPPPYPVIWLVKGRAPVPWGERIQLN